MDKGLKEALTPYTPFLLPALAGVGLAFKSQLANIWQHVWDFINPWKIVSIDSQHPAFDAVIDDIHKLDATRSRQSRFLDTYRFVPIGYTLLKKNKIGIDNFFVRKEEAKDSLNIKYTLDLYTTKKKIKKVQAWLLEKKNPDKLVEYYFSTNMGSTVDRKQSLGFDNIIDADGVYAEVLKDVEWFFNNKDYYDSLGFKYKRTALLNSGPGSGKTKCVHAIASELQCTIIVLGDQFRHWFSNTAYLINKVKKENPGQPIILLCEEFDKIYALELKENVVDHNLLSFLDGIQTPEGVYMFFLTNSIENISPIVLRPGRIDKVFNIPMCSENQIKAIHAKYKSETTLSLEEFLNSLEKRDYSFAEIKTMIIK